MLIAHPSSTCDVCLENYTEDCSYHSIPCGHIFCLPCLMNTDPPRCPLCRHEFSFFNIRKIHITLPTPRDAEARHFEKKLLENGPNTPLEESFALYEQIQSWVREEDCDEYLTLRAFAACLCSYYELRDKIATLEENSQIERITAEDTQTELRRSLDEARRIPPGDDSDYRTKYRLAELELADLRSECADLRSQAVQYQQQEKEGRNSLEALRSQFQTCQTEVNTLRTECGTLRVQVEGSYREEQKLQAYISQIEKRHRQEKQLLAEHRKYYADYVVQMEQQQQQVLAQQEAAVSRRRSNPLPPPPRPIDLDSFKLSKPGPSSSVVRSDNIDKGKVKETPNGGPSHHDPMASAYVPTLAASIVASAPVKKDGSDSDGRTEVTTLIFKPPVRMPLIPPALNGQYLVKDADLHLYNEAGTSSGAEKVSEAGAVVGQAQVASQPLVRISHPGPSRYGGRQPSSSRNAMTDVERPSSSKPSFKLKPRSASNSRPSEESLAASQQAERAIVLSHQANVHRRSTVHFFQPEYFANAAYDVGEPMPVSWDGTVPAPKKPRRRARHDSYGYSYVPAPHYAPPTEYISRPLASHIQEGIYNDEYPSHRPYIKSTSPSGYRHPREGPSASRDPSAAIYPSDNQLR